MEGITPPIPFIEPNCGIKRIKQIASVANKKIEINNIRLTCAWFLKIEKMAYAKQQNTEIIADVLQKDKRETPIIIDKPIINKPCCQIFLQYLNKTNVERTP